MDNLFNLITGLLNNQNCSFLDFAEPTRNIQNSIKDVAVSVKVILFWFYVKAFFGLLINGKVHMENHDATKIVS